MKVQPKDDNVRKLLKHPVAKGFRAEGPAEWPMDSFTLRRIRDGDITVVEEQKEQPQHKRSREKSREEVSS